MCDWSVIGFPLPPLLKGKENKVITIAVEGVLLRYSSAGIVLKL